MDRCPWAKTDLYVHYHDTEWGVPVHDGRLLFEFLILDGAQAGLSDCPGRVVSVRAATVRERFFEPLGSRFLTVAALKSPLWDGFSLIIRVQGVETLMGRGESRRVVRFAADDLDVARRIPLGGLGQRGVEFAKRGNFRREPTPAAQGGGQGVIVPGGEVVVDPIRIRLDARSTM